MARLISPIRQITQPQQFSGIDWSNPLTSEMKFATVADNRPMFYNYLDNTGSVDNYAPDFSFKNPVIYTPYGKARKTNGGAYANHNIFKSPRTSPGICSSVVIVRVNATPAGWAPFMSSGEGLGAWYMNIIGLQDGYFKAYPVNATTYCTSDQPCTVGKTYIVGFTSNATTPIQRLYVNGRAQASTTVETATVNKMLDKTYFQGANTSIVAAFCWSRELSPAEMASIYDNPFQVFRSVSVREYMFPLPVTGNTHTLPVAPYELTLTASDSNVKANRKILSETGSHLLSGVSSSFIMSRVINAQSGQYPLVGTSINIGRNLKIPAETGVFLTAINPANIGKSRFITGDTSNYNLSGTNSKLSISRNLAIGNGTYSVSTIPAVFKTSRRIVNTSRSFNISNINSSFKLTRKVQASKSSYSINVAPTWFKTSRKILLNKGLFNQNSINAQIKITRNLLISTGSYLSVFNNTPINRGFDLKANIGSYIIEGNPQYYVYYRKLVASNASYNILGIGTTLSPTSARQIAGNPAIFSLTGGNLGIKSSRNLIPDLGYFHNVGASIELKYTRKVNSTVTSFNVSFSPISSIFTRKVRGSTETLTGIGNSTGFKIARKLPLISGSFNTEDVNNELKLTRKLTAQTTSFIEVGNNLIVNYDRKLLATSDNFELKGTDVSLNGASTVSITGSFGQFVITTPSIRFKATKKLSGEPADYNVEGFNTDTRVARKIVHEPQFYSLIASGTGLSRGHRLSVNSEMLILEPKDTLVKLNRNMKGVTKNLNLSYKPVFIRYSGGRRSFFTRFREMFIRL